MTNDNKLQSKYKWIPPRNGSSAPEIYTNYVISSWSNYDVRFRLGQLIPSGEGAGEFVVEEKAGVTFTWQHAKYIHRLLGELVKSYEEANGEIGTLKLPSDPTSKKPEPVPE
jgi:hypothetical protein